MMGLLLGCPDLQRLGLVLWIFAPLFSVARLPSLSRSALLWWKPPCAVLEKGTCGCEQSSHSLGQVLSRAPANCFLASPEEWASLRVSRLGRCGVKKEKSRKSEAHDFPANSRKPESGWDF